MPWNDNANPGPWGSPSGGDDKREQPRRPSGGGPRRPGGPDFNAGFEDISRRIRDLLGGGGGGGGGPPNRRVIAIGAGVVVALWAASGFYLVQPNEKAVVLTFGAYSRTQDPGLHYHLPAPIERVEKVPVTSLKRTEVGAGSGAETEGLMLTGDEQIVDIAFSVTWRIADPARYLFATRDPEYAVKAVAESAMREVVGRSELESIISQGRGQVQVQTADVIQRTLTAWGTGVSVVEVQISKATAPADVAAAFRDVQRAFQDAEALENEANGYRNRVINEAKGDAARITQAAQAYREQAVREAAGEAARFDQIYTEYRRAPGVTRDRLYIETMQRILQSSNKVIVDSKGASAPIILPPDVFRPRAQPAAAQPRVEAEPVAPAQGRAAQ
ncbi:FtsH protease activity modulator HflK [Phenylobacterium sp.]|uniref:FtsH protease activity modulator HflK n=1 Tax=Phenylobacterium sp. TaxID=1871053 RepID=UPI00301C4E5F